MQTQFNRAKHFAAFGCRTRYSSPSSIHYHHQRLSNYRLARRLEAYEATDRTREWCFYCIQSSRGLGLARQI